MKKLYGAETKKALANFQISDEKMPLEIIHWLARIKVCAANANAELGLLSDEKANLIVHAGSQVVNGLHDEQFPLDVFQTGSGTSSNMNVNEVIASLAGSNIHPNDDVNLGQSSNDVFPTAIHLASLSLLESNLFPALEKLAQTLEVKSNEFDAVVKTGRTHMMDAVPITLGQEFSGYMSQVKLSQERIVPVLNRLQAIPLGGTAVGTGLNAHPHFAEVVRKNIENDYGIKSSAPANSFEAQACRDTLAELSGTLKVLALSLLKISNDLRLMASGPRCGLGEINIPELQKGSSIMPGKTNPVMIEMLQQVCAQVIGNDATITFANTQAAFELNVAMPVMAKNIIQSIMLLSNAITGFDNKCIMQITANTDVCLNYAENSLSIVTSLNNIIGYDQATKIAKEAQATNRSIREVALEHGVEESILDEALDLKKMTES